MATLLVTGAYGRLPVVIKHSRRYYALVGAGLLNFSDSKFSLRSSTACIIKLVTIVVCIFTETVISPSPSGTTMHMTGPITVLSMEIVLAYGIVKFSGRKKIKRQNF
jgi:hypothetical protein